MKRCVVCGKNNRDFVSLEFAWFGPNLCNICAFKCKGLSLWQPWAGLVAAGLKPIETRWWKTSYRGKVLICSAKRIDRELTECQYRDELETDYSRIGASWKSGGFALCVADMIDCRPMLSTDQTPSYVKYDPRRFSWILKNIIPVAPFPVIGRQRLFKVNETILRKAV